MNRGALKWALATTQSNKMNSDEVLSNYSVSPHWAVGIT
jgi:hypothetical protein